MFGVLAGKIDTLVKKLAARGTLDERAVDEALHQLRMALLEADVNYRVAKDFVAAVRARALRQEVLRSVNPGHQVAAAMWEEMVGLLGGKAEPLRWGSFLPFVVMLAGLQGSGKTTTAAKLALLMKRQHKKVMLVAADVYRPAATEQLWVLAQQVGVPCVGGQGDPVELARMAVEEARRQVFDAVILDTAGRLHVDRPMMEELSRIVEVTHPHERLLVVDGMSGQDAVRTVEEFHRVLGATGLILTKLDGDARGGVALSARAVTGIPIKFVGTGEKLEDLEPFHPDRMASRIMGMGDVLTLVEKARAEADEAKAREVGRRLRRGQLTMDDVLQQLRQVKKMGSLDQLLSLVPGLGKGLPLGQLDERQLSRAEAIILSMTKEERARPSLIDGSRRKRIARGSGTSVQEVNKLLREFEAMQQMMKRLGKARVSKAFLYGKGR